MTLDAELHLHGKKIKGLQSQQEAIISRQIQIDRMLDQHYVQQQAISRGLDRAIDELNKQISPSEGENTLISAAHRLSNDVSILEDQTAELQLSLNSATTKKYPEVVVSIVETLNLHQQSLDGIRHSAVDLKKRIDDLETELVL
ncbi:MAG: hypothetical protein KVP17_000953 [Porospora cf. gigantea B]|uniref:uncharacterized protein n=1 Tax=Porospora cf. gigantea B TaxID=2853592 RepID=UPI003571F947|nr:MAG: hypothetical protein KVP17_000953 [Porospora cf. gigantea B]